MDIAAGLDAALLRRQAAHAEHAEQARAARREEDRQKPAVDFGGAVSQTQADDDVKQADPTATYDRTREREDPPRLIDLVV